MKCENKSNKDKKNNSHTVCMRKANFMFRLTLQKTDNNNPYLYVCNDLLVHRDTTMPKLRGMNQVSSDTLCVPTQTTILFSVACIPTLFKYLV